MCIGVALVLASGATLAHEVLLTRIIAIVHWHHFASVIISIALLGFGVSGTLLVLLDGLVRRRPAAVRRVSLGALAVALPLSVAVSMRVPLNIEALGWGAEQTRYLALYALVLAGPFLPAAAYIAVVLRQAGARVGLFYGLNLLGSGAGAALGVGCMGLLTPEQIVWLLTALAVAAWAADVATHARRAALVGAVVGLAVVAWGSTHQWLRIDPSGLKPLPAMLQVKDARLLDTRFGVQGRVQVVDDPWLRPDFRGLSMQYALDERARPPEHRYIVVDGASVRSVLRPADPDQSRFLDYLQTRLAYDLSSPRRVLVLAPDSDVPVLLALRCGARHVDVVEPHQLVAELLRADLAEFTLALYRRPNVALWAGRPRRFLDRTAERFDTVFITLGESMGAAGTAVGLEQRYLLTVEAYVRAIDRLDTDGWLVLTCGATPPPRDLLRLVNTLIAAARHAGLDPARSLAVIRDTDVATVFLKKGHVTPPEVRLVERFVDRMGFDPVWYPGLDPARVNRTNVLSLYPRRADESDQRFRLRNAVYYHGVTALLSEARREFVRDHPFRLSPSTDDCPFFYHFFKWSSVGQLRRMQGDRWMRYVEKGYWFQWHALWLVGAAAAVLVLVPLALVRRLRRQTRGRGAMVVYFALLGLGYILLELAMISHAVRLLGYPTAAVGVVLATFLVSSGLGSLIAGRPQIEPRRCIRIAAVSVVVLGLGAAASLAGLNRYLAGGADVLRTIAVVATLAPVSLAMGMLMPSGLRVAGAGQPHVVPWAWGINGFASVSGALLATLVSADYGFTATLALALAAYALAAIVGPRLQGRDP